LRYRPKVGARVRSVKRSIRPGLADREESPGTPAAKIAPLVAPILLAAQTILP